MLQTGKQVNIPAEAAIAAAPKTTACGPALNARLQALVPVPAATLVALGVHLGLPNNELPPDARLYSRFLALVLAAGLGAAVIQLFWPGLAGG